MTVSLLQVMGITDPAEFQRVAREYCKDAAAEMMLPAYLRIFSRINNIVDKQRDKFDGLRKRTEMVKHVLKVAMDDEEVVNTFKDALAMKDKEAVKSPELSGNKRSAGNAAFQKKKDVEAVRLYTEAVFTADMAGEEGRADCSLALANRSAAWLRLRRYADSLDDIETALHLGYPQAMLYKLVDRRARCLAELGRSEEARTAFQRVSLLLKQSGLEASKQAEWEKTVQAGLAGLKTGATKSRPAAAAAPLLPDPNRRVPQLSSAVELAYSPLVGRHAVATRDISPGEVVMLDTALAAHLLCSSRLTHCAHCMTKVELSTGKPSPLCNTTMFCRYKCLEAAMCSYHPVESRINIQKLFWNKRDETYEELSGNILLTYRAITQKPLQFFLDSAQNWDQVDDMFGVEFSDDEEQCEYSDYRNLWNLTAHRDRKTKDELLSLSIRSAIFVVLLR